MAKVIGIDLGTTNSVMARLDRDQPRVIETVDGTSFTVPSVVGMSDTGERLVGAPARLQAVRYPTETIFSVKRFMGRKFKDQDVQQDIGLVPYKVTEASNGEIEVWLQGKPYSPIEISAVILAALKREAEEQIGEVSHAVITVPAYFGQRQRAATRAAGKLAGLQVMRVLSEPTAAALAFGISSQSTEPRNLLVYDLGGGTFDVTVMLAASGTFNELSKRGHNHLGGDDFDQQIIKHILEDTKSSSGVDLREHPAAMQKLKDQAEQTKIQLTRRERVKVIIPDIASTGRGRTVDVNLELTRPQYEGMIRGYVAKTLELVHDAIRAAHLQPSDIDHILLVGGSTGTPLIVDSLRREFGEEKILRGINPMQAVALGAAVQSGIISTDEAEEGEELPTFECKHCGRPNSVGAVSCLHCEGEIGLTVSGRPPASFENTARPVGIQAAGDRMEVIVPKDTPFPTREPATRYFKTTVASQRAVRVPVYEGEDEVASRNEYLGEAEGDLPDGLPEGTEVAVSFEIDFNGIIAVTARIPSAPHVTIAASVDLKGRRADPPSGKPGEVQWRAMAQGQLARLQAIVTNYGQHIDQGTRQRLAELAAELGGALASDNEALAEAKMEELNEALQEVAWIDGLVMADALSKYPGVPRVQQALVQQHLDAARLALRRGDKYALMEALRELRPAIEEAFECIKERPDHTDLLTAAL